MAHLRRKFIVCKPKVLVKRDKPGVAQMGKFNLKLHKVYVNQVLHTWKQLG